MGKLIAGLASSHAATLEDPQCWTDHRTRNRQGYARRYGVLPPEQPQVTRETPDDLKTRYANIRRGLDALKQKLEEQRPDALIIIGDDQNEVFPHGNSPQIAVYVGDGFLAQSRDPKVEPLHYRSSPQLGEAILTESVDSGIDMFSVRSLPDNILHAHAIGPVLRVVDPQAKIPVVPIFINAIHVPAPSPPRCYLYGQAIRRAVEKCAGVGRVAIYASGGMSHFTAGYPWKHYQGSYTHGGISEDFDRWLMTQMKAGAGSRFAELTNAEIIGNGEIEFRSWITMLGAIGDTRPEFLTYEPFYSAIMGTAVGYWDLVNQVAARDVARAEGKAR